MVFQCFAIFFSGFPFFFRWCMGLKIHRFHGKFLPNDSSTVTAEEERFARQFLRAASLAGFTPLSRFDLDRWYRWGSGRIETPKLDGLRLEMTCLLIFIDVYWCLLMFIDVYWSVLMFIDVYWCLLMFIDIYWSLLIFIDLYWSLLMFINVYWCLLMFIDLYWCLLMFIDLYWSLLIFIDVY